MPNKIISQTKKTSFLLLNIILLLFTLAIVLIISSYQLFVDKNYRPLSFKNLLNPKFIIQTINLKRAKPSSSCFTNIGNIIYGKNNSFLSYDFNSNEEKLLFALEKGELSSPLFMNKKKNMLAFILKDNDGFWIYLYDIEQKQTSKLLLEGKIAKAGIINFDKLDNVYFYYKSLDDNFWTIALFNKLKINPFVKNISYSGINLTRSAEPINNIIIYPECNKSCQFMAYNIADKTTEKINIATEDGSPEVISLNMLFYDENTGKIIYQLPNKNVTLISDFKGYLWHHIYLEPAKGNIITINGMLTDSKGIKKLIAFSELKKQAYIYDINYIGLQMIDLKENQKVVEDQINSPQGCLLLEKRNIKEFAIKDINSLEEKILKTGVDYLQLIP